MNVPSGYTALDLIGFTDRGDYSSSATYVRNDLVHHNNSIWRCLVDDTTAVTPAEGANWTVYIQNGTTLNGMADVNLTNPANGDLLRYNSTSSKWENQDADSSPTQNSTKLVQSGGVYTQLANKANTADLATVATSGAYSDLSGTPSLAAVATSGAYSDLTGTPTIPTVNNGILTIQKNGANVATFTANSSTDQTANISVPTKTSDLNNDSNFVSDANYQHITVDSAMSSSSANPVQNQVIYGELSDVKQALSNEVATRATLGAHNLLPLSLDTIKSLNTAGTWSGNKYTASNNACDFTVNTDSEGNVTSIGVEVKAISASDMGLALSKENFGNADFNTNSTPTANGYTISYGDTNNNFRLQYLASSILTRIVVLANTPVSTKTMYPMIRLASDTDPTFQPYAMTNRELTEKVDKIETINLTLNSTYFDNNAVCKVKKVGKLVSICISGTTIGEIPSGNTNLSSNGALPTPDDGEGIIGFAWNTSGILGQLRINYGYLNFPFNGAIPSGTSFRVNMVYISK